MAVERTLAVSLIDQATELELSAEAAEITAAHFRHRFEACWEKEPGGDGVGGIINAELAMWLRPHVLDNESQAKRWRKMAQELRDAAALVVPELTPKTEG